jgi:hypothetical protein
MEQLCVRCSASLQVTLALILHEPGCPTCLPPSFAALERADRCQLTSSPLRLRRGQRCVPVSPLPLSSPTCIRRESIFDITWKSSRDPSCPRTCSSSVLLIRLLLASFLRTTDHPGHDLSRTKNTCSILTAWLAISSAYTANKH